MYIDEKFKDAAPIDTYNRITQILHSHNIQTTEHWGDCGVGDCFSVRISVDDAGFACNGKGVTKKLARTSGYAEMMERLQGGDYIFREALAADMQWLTRDELLTQCGSYLKKFAEVVTQIGGKPFTEEDAADAAIFLDDGTRARCAPYYSVFDDCFVQVPVALMLQSSSTNGLAAGNSTQEALVQGFSEIIERKCQRQFLNEKLTPPTIPDTYLQNFPTAWKIITDIRKAGFDVFVKDCSLGEGYPVIAAVILNKTAHTYHIHFGAFPVFEIALERSLTETFQGRSLTNLTAENVLFSGKKRSYSESAFAYVKGYGIYPAEFFGSTPSYPFVPFEDFGNATNHDLFRKVLRYCRDNHLDLYVRDKSILGFPTFRIIVPGYSEVFPQRFIGNSPLYKLERTARATIMNISKAPADALMSYLLYYIGSPKTPMLPVRFTSITRLPLNIEFWKDASVASLSAAYAAYALGNLKQALEFAAASMKGLDKESSDLLLCLCKTLQFMLNGYRAEAALCYLRSMFSEDICSLLEDDFRENRNPFARFVVCCDENCADCKNSCNATGRAAVQQVLTDCTKAFDFSAAMEKLAQTIRKHVSETK